MLSKAVLYCHFISLFIKQWEWGVQSILLYAWRDSAHIGHEHFLKYLTYYAKLTFSSINFFLNFFFWIQQRGFIESSLSFNILRLDLGCFLVYMVALRVLFCSFWELFGTVVT